MTAKQFSEESYKRETLKNQNVEIAVLPRIGANLVSLKVDDREFVHFDKKTIHPGGDFTGSFMMFPTPCRLTDSKYTFDGKEIKQRKNGEDVFIHGLVRDEPFDFTRTQDSMACTIKIDKDHPVYEGYPFPCVFSLTFSLLENGAQLTFEYENTGTQDTPFGFGIHGYWAIPGERKDVYIQVPCDQALELVDLIPTGNTESVEGTNLDLRTFTSLENLYIDNAFYGRDPQGTQAIQYRDLGLQFTLQSSEIFEHMIAYAPQGAPFVCMENLTCTPDAPNVFAKGKEKVSGLKVVSPGGKLKGTVKYLVTKI